MSNPLDITVGQAREIVLAESKKKGWARPELLQSQNPEAQEALELLRNTREALGDTVDILARGIYSRRGRFILELIQNVEDCDFNHTDTPSISFEVGPQKIVVESNQDGFKATDVAQICHTGNSWKRGRRGYVGEKGIGFKSVFKVASRVDIQSNAFSFFFEYNGGETSEERLGIITPIVGNDPIPPNERPLTRMTLTLNGDTPYPDLVSDFTAIPETLLLFLTKLKEIRFKIHFPDQGRTAFNIFRKSAEADGTTRISKVEEGSDRPDEWRYHVVRAPVEGLPHEPDRPEITECEGVLAFPVDDHGRPRIHTGYDVYAFLPVCTVGFNFLLQADFLLEASRQEVIVDSAWNNTIIDSIAEAFCNAMVRFCANPSLRFHWMRFLPIGRAFGMNPLWKNLSSKVIDLLNQQRVLYPHDPSQLYLQGLLSQASSLRTLPPNYLDRNGLPLFADRPGINRKYLSLCYEQEDVEVLKTAFLLRDIEDIHMFYRIKQDLESPSSIMTDAGTAADWHSRAADLISSILERSPDVGSMIKDRLDLIPLSDGRWVRASTEDLHFPSRNEPAIPPDLVTTIHQTAARNTSRRIMFEYLGVTGIHSARVIDRLWASYLQHDGAFNLGASKAHFMYLYWHYANIDDARFSRLWLYNSHLNKVTCQHSLMYMPFDDEYGPLELLKAVPDPGNPRHVAPECPVVYLNAEYMDLFPPTTRRHDLSWLDWLERVLRVRRMPRLKHDAGSLSPEFRHILRYRPEKIVRLLGMHWALYRREMNNRIEEEISRAEVTCQDASRAVLSSTYFPLPSLTQKAQELRIPRSFPFLAVPGLSEEDRAFEDWRFLERFDVKFEANLAFYLDALRQHEAQVHQSWNSDTRNGILKTYEWIADQYNEMNRTMVVETFHRDSLILHPRAFQSGSTTASWLDAQSCVWRGPENLLDKTSLATVALYRSNRKVERLFREILGIKNANWCDYRDMLLQFRRSQTTPPDLWDKILRLYKLLSESRISDEDWGSLLNTFENDRLIYVPSGPAWFAPSQCLWASPVPIPGKAIMDDLYSDDLRPFFQDRLRISPAALTTLVEGLCSLAHGQPSIIEVKKMIWAISAKDPKRSDLTPLLSCNILPVKKARHDSANVSLQNCGSDFTVVDRTKLADIFKGHVGFLDFSLEEVRQLDPFLQALDLSKKYLSRVCTDETACSDDGVLDVDLTENFKNRAYDLLRCAVSSRSPLVQGGPLLLYNRLLATTVLKTDGISTQYTVTYESGNKIGPITRSTGHVHIQERDGGWQIFVPRNGDAREVCYMRELPHALTKLFKIAQSTSENISHVLNSSIAVIDELLEQGGIGKVPGIESPPRRAVEGMDEYGVDIGEEAAPSEVSGAVPRAFSRSETPSSSIFGERDVRTPPRQVVPPPRSPSLAYPEGNDFFTDNAYLELLDNVIRIARRTILPHSNALAGPANGQFHPGFDHDAAFGTRSQGQMNHDFKIGAAGELFAYECLANLALSSFGWHNWTSTIRKEVLIHPEYRDMGAWPGRRETSDLLYDDTRSMLTRYLINAGYLDENVWAGATPKYLIEVKTTTGRFGDRFYMSSNQFRLMQNMALAQGQISEGIYILFRVYNLGRDNLNVRIYVDPEAHRGRSLAFVEHTWAVTAIQ
ncbi:uncharacterized protein PAC_17309 [Phialocephala subalpina]|uniref:Protein NO VEIN C-terminal domain-containing protein n=1 Tax=Phialocephala subalpina TaxID=576137 RepID=A0A1L7XQU2_9HELO|nr:uncharacterized protein PAC_17309 [Phialocephala subalpina]